MLALDPKVIDRFHSYYEAEYWEDEQGKLWLCWVWKKALDKDGYGKFRGGKKFYRAHKLSWELFNGDIPEDMEIDHLCRNRRCVNPEHLECVTHQVNQARMTKCPNGHYYDSEFGDKRLCTTCGAVTPKRRGT